MQEINFSLKKDNKFIIKENNIKCINQNNKLLFKIDGIKYTYYNNILIKESGNDIITLDFNKKESKIYLKDINNSLYLKIQDVNIKNNKNLIKIEYKIETEKNSLNIISLEYKKSS